MNAIIAFAFPLIAVRSHAVPFFFFAADDGPAVRDGAGGLSGRRRATRWSRSKPISASIRGSSRGTPPPGNMG